MKFSIKGYFFFVLVTFCPFAGVSVNAQCISLTGAPYTQDFNTLSVAGSANTTLPPGILINELGLNANETYAADDGGENDGNTYSYGSVQNIDRALGELTTGTLRATIGACFTNNTGSTIGVILFGYTGEQWRLGDASTHIDLLEFQYSLDATGLRSGTWRDVDPLDFATPNTRGPGAKDGNAAPNRIIFPITPILLPAGIPPGSTFFIRWIPLDSPSQDDGLAIDDLTLATLTPTAALVSISGRATNGKSGIPGVRITLTDDTGSSRSVLTNSFGYYQFEGVEAGRIYVIGVSSRRYVFDNPAQVFQLADAIENLDFYAYDQSSFTNLFIVGQKSF